METLSAQYDSTDDPNVVRAKYFIRGEFLVSDFAWD